MSYYIALIFTIIVAFLLGSIPFGLILGKLFARKDPRNVGSGSTGATNVNRAAGWKAGVATFFCDAAKGTLAVLFARFLNFYVVGISVWSPDLLLGAASIAAIVGHCYSPWLHGKGGKGIAVAEGTAVGIYPLVAFILLIIFFIIVVISKIISVGPIGVVIAYPIVVSILYPGNIILLVTAILTMSLIIFAHRQNIVRLKNGQEPKFSFNTGKREES